MDEEKREEEFTLFPWARVLERAREISARHREERIRRNTEIVESLSEKYPELSRVLKDFIHKRVTMETTKDGGIFISYPADVYEEGYSIKFKCRERTCTVRGVIETAGDRGSMELFREKMRYYGCKILSSEICKDEYCIASVRIRCSMSVDKLVEFIDKVLRRYL